MALVWGLLPKNCSSPFHSSVKRRDHFIPLRWKKWDGVEEVCFFATYFWFIPNRFYKLISTKLFFLPIAFFFFATRNDPEKKTVPTIYPNYSRPNDRKGLGRSPLFTEFCPEAGQNSVYCSHRFAW